MSGKLAGIWPESNAKPVFSAAIHHCMIRLSIRRAYNNNKFDVTKFDNVSLHFFAGLCCDVVCMYLVSGIRKVPPR